jgi:hypothetical protein
MLTLLGMTQLCNSHDPGLLNCTALHFTTTRYGARAGRNVGSTGWLPHFLGWCLGYFHFFCYVISPIGHTLEGVCLAAHQL